jgi:hypothetical protein
MDKVSNSDAQESTNGQRMDSQMPINLSIWAEKAVLLGSINQRMVNEWTSNGDPFVDANMSTNGGKSLKGCPSIR